MSIFGPLDDYVSLNNSYADIHSDRVFVIARVGVREKDAKNIDLNASEQDVNIGTIFRHSYGVSAAAWNPTTGLFTAPVGGLYAFTVHLLILTKADKPRFGGVYASINGSTAVTTDPNIACRLYQQTDNRDRWHPFEFADLVSLNQGETLGLNCMYGAGVWAFNAASTLKIGRVSI